MNIFFKIFAAVFAGLFVWATFMQYNDPDAILWYLVYGAAAMTCICFLFDKLDYRHAYLFALAYLIGVFLSWPSHFEGVSVGQGELDNVEHAREAFGLLISSGVMGLLGFRVKRKEQVRKAFH